MLLKLLKSKYSFYPGEAATNQDLGRLIETELTKATLTSYLTTDDHDR